MGRPGFTTVGNRPFFQIKRGVVGQKRQNKSQKQQGLRPAQKLLKIIKGVFLS